nr:hypothetical protein CFP56_32160 [Quercus suber]
MQRGSCTRQSAAYAVEWDGEIRGPGRVERENRKDFPFERWRPHGMATVQYSTPQEVRGRLQRDRFSPERDTGRCQSCPVQPPAAPTAHSGCRLRREGPLSKPRQAEGPGGWTEQEQTPESRRPRLPAWASPAWQRRPRPGLLRIGPVWLWVKLPPISWRRPLLPAQSPVRGEGGNTLDIDRRSEPQHRAQRLVLYGHWHSITLVRCCAAHMSTVLYDPVDALELVGLISEHAPWRSCVADAPKRLKLEAKAS